MAKYLAPAVVALLLVAGGCTADRGKDVATTESYPAHGPEPSPAAADRPAEANRDLPPQPQKSKVAFKKKAAAAAAQGLPAHAYDDPRHIPVGIVYNDMVRRFGPPSMRVTDGPDRSSLSYATRKSRVQVEVRNGKVVSVEEADTGL